MTETPTEDTTTNPAVEELVARFREARVRRAQIAEEDRQLKKIEEEVTNALHVNRSWKQVGAILGFSGSRAEAIARGR